MLPFFPDLLEDELLYSALARYADRRKMRHSQLVYGLTGRQHHPIAYNLPTRIDHLITVIPSGHPYTSDQLLDHHTLLPFYAPFMMPDKVTEVRQLMKGSTATAISAKIGINASRTLKNSHLRYCPICADLDEKRRGYSYWHRLHQLPSIDICAVHNIWLENSDLEVRQTQKAFISAERTLIEKQSPRPISQSEDYDRVVLNLAKDAQWLLRETPIPVGSKALVARYRDVLRHMGLTSKNGIPRLNLVRKAFKGFYLDDTLDRLGYLPGGDNSKDWLYRLLSVARQGFTQQPISHLLFIHFLGLDAATFFSRKNDLPLFSFFAP